VPLNNQKQVMAGLDKLAGRSLGAASGVYRRNVVDPLVDTIANARGIKDLQRRLGASLLKRMDTTEFEENVAQALVQAELIGRTTATPRKKEGKK
jgi:phage gp29-like protein